MQKIEQTLVLFRHLNTEPYIFTLQALERRAVPDHKSLLNATFKYIERGNPVFQNLYQQEVGLGRIDFESREFFYGFVHLLTFGKNQVSGLLIIVVILKKHFSGESTEAVQ